MASLAREALEKGVAAPLKRADTNKANGDEQSQGRKSKRERGLGPNSLTSSDLFQRPRKAMHIGGRRPCRARVPERRWILYINRLAGTIKSSRFPES
jgi:hypothetical protein